MQNQGKAAVTFSGVLAENCSLLAPPRGDYRKEAHTLENQGRLKCSSKSGLRHLIGEAFCSARLFYYIF